MIQPAREANLSLSDKRHGSTPLFKVKDRWERSTDRCPGEQDDCGLLVDVATVAEGAEQSTEHQAAAWLCFIVTWHDEPSQHAHWQLAAR